MTAGAGTLTLSHYEMAKTACDYRKICNLVDVVNEKRYNSDFMGGVFHKNGPLECLSRMSGNLHVRFLGGGKG